MIYFQLLFMYYLKHEESRRLCPARDARSETFKFSHKLDGNSDLIHIPLRIKGDFSLWRLREAPLFHLMLLLLFSSQNVASVFAQA